MTPKTIKACMNKRIKKKWIKALESGEYAQGKGALCVEPDDPKDDTRFCSLGVLCEIYAQEMNIPWEESYYYGQLMMEEEPHTLPLQVVDWADLLDNDPIVRLHDGSKKRISEANDMEMSFLKMAKIIKEQL